MNIAAPHLLNEVRGCGFGAIKNIVLKYLNQERSNSQNRQHGIADLIGLVI